jgi:hypothetical protein
MNTKTMKLLKVGHVQVGPRGFEKTVALSCEFNGAKYHIWLTPDTMNVGEVLYKNPLKGMKSSDPDYFRTRTLKPGSDFVDTLIASMVEIYKAKSLLSKFLMREATEQQESNAEAAKQNRILQLRQAGPRLFDAMVAIAQIAEEKSKRQPIRGEGLYNVSILQIARDAIKAANETKY